MVKGEELRTQEISRMLVFCVLPSLLFGFANVIADSCFFLEGHFGSLDGSSDHLLLSPSTDRHLSLALTRIQVSGDHLSDSLCWDPIAF